MEEFQVILSPESQKQIEIFTQEDPQQVMGGILLGHFISTGNGLQITVNAVIRTNHKDSFLKEIHFDHQIWREIYRIKSLEFPEHEIVGWFHTLPGKPLIPGDQDYTIQKAFFPEPHKVLMLIDSIKHLSCIFYWQKNFLVPYSDFSAEPKPINIPNEITYVETSNFREIAMEAQEMLQQYSNISTNIGAMLDKRINSEEEKTDSTGIGTGIDTVTSPEMSGTMSTGLKVIGGIALVLTLIIFLMYPVIKPVNTQVALKTADEKNSTVQKTTVKTPLIDDKKQTATNKMPNIPQSKSAGQGSTINKTTQTVNEPTKPEANLKALNNGEQLYTIQPGDSLWGISTKFYGSGFDFYKIIQANEIINPNNLRVGTVLVIPD